MPIIRDLNKSDIPQAVRLTEEMWYSEKDLPRYTEDERHTAAALCASYYIRKATFARACEMDGRFVGMIFGRVDGDDPIFSDIEFDLTLLDSDMISEALSIGRAYDELYERCRGRGYDCELRLYITDERFRGKGIGSALLEDYLSYLRSKGKKRMYLHTDDYCDTGFYLRRGFSNDCCVKVFLDGKDHDFFIFSLDI